MSEVYQIQHLDAAHSHLSPSFTNNLTLHTVPIPSPGPEEVLVRIRAVSLNFRDLLIVAGSPLYPTRAIPNLIPCCDGAGEIIRTGPNSKWQDSIGDAVIVTPTTSWIDGDVESFKFETARGGAAVQGLLAQYVVVSDPWLVRAPKNFSYEEAAALPCAGATAMNVLSSISVGKDTTVVAQGTGGVSCFIIQFATAMGATVLATSSSDAKLQTSKQLGASQLINYRTIPSWGTEVLRLTNGRGVDLVADVGGSGTIEESVKALRQGGIACMIGFLAPPKEYDILQPLVVAAKSLKGIIGFSRKMIEDTVELVEKHDLHPLIKVFEWEDAKKAFETLRDQDVIGKVVIKV